MWLEFFAKGNQTRNEPTPTNSSPIQSGYRTVVEWAWASTALEITHPINWNCATTASHTIQFLSVRSFRAMEHVPKELFQGSFVDYGAGKGRAFGTRARYYPFRQVLGVEMSSELV